MSRPTGLSTAEADAVDESAVVESLSAQHLAVRVGREDGTRPALLVSDGELTVEVNTEVGPRRAAIRGLQRLAATALAVAAELEVTVDTPDGSAAG